MKKSKDEVVEKVFAHCLDIRKHSFIEKEKISRMHIMTHTVHNVNSTCRSNIIELCKGRVCVELI